MAEKLYLPALDWVMHRRTLTLGVAAGMVVVTGILPLRLGGEFLPRMGEGAIVASVVRLAGVSVEESVAYNTKLEALVKEKFPDEVRHVWSRLRQCRGRHRPDGDGAD